MAAAGTDQVVMMKERGFAGQIAYDAVDILDHQCSKGKGGGIGAGIWQVAGRHNGGAATIGPDSRKVALASAGRTN